MTNAERLTDAKRRVCAHLEAVLTGAEDVFAEGAVMQAAHPWGRRAGRVACAAPYAQIAAALDHATRRPEIVIAGSNHPDARKPGPRPSPLVGVMGSIQGVFARPLCGIAPTGRAVHLRIAEVVHLDGDDRIDRAWILPDLLDLMDQAGCWPAALPRPAGAAGLWPGPAGGGGVRLDLTDPDAGARCLAAVLGMHDDLHRFDGGNLSSMPMGAWAEGFAYYAGGGIGICKGLDSFRAHHQGPFLRAFPDRRATGHFVRIGDGPFALTGGRVAVTHSGPFLGVPATHRALEAFVMDFYRFDSRGQIAENWLPIDMAGLLADMGVGVLPAATAGDAPAPVD